MWKLRQICLALVAMVAMHAKAAALGSSDTPRDLSGQVSVAAAFTNAVQVSLCAELTVLDGGPLTQALAGALGRGVHVRLILDKADKDTRLQGLALARDFQMNSSTVTATLELRWAKTGSMPQRRLLADGQRVLRWLLGEDPWRDDVKAEPLLENFELRWQQASQDLSESQALEDALRALPDPREKEPRIVKRRDAAGE